MSNEALISLSNVTASYEGGASVLAHLSFEVRRGEFIALVGSNGAGKSTTLRLIDGLVKPDSGRVEVCGYDTRQTRTSELSAHVGFLFQNPDHQICCNTVREELAFSLRGRGLLDDEATRKVRDMVADFDFDADADPFSLGRGQRQRIALASALIANPEILILDEPTSGLDYRECMHIMDRVEEANETGTTVIMVCHDMEVVADFASRVIVLAGGRVAGEGRPHEVFRDEALMTAAGLVAPQMVQVATAASKLDPRLAEADTVEEVVAATRELVGEGRAS